MYRLSLCSTSIGCCGTICSHFELYIALVGRDASNLHNQFSPNLSTSTKKFIIIFYLFYFVKEFHQKNSQTFSTTKNEWIEMKLDLHHHYRNSVYIMWKLWLNWNWFHFHLIDSAKWIQTKILDFYYLIFIFDLTSFSYEKFYLFYSGETKKKKKANFFFIFFY